MEAISELFDKTTVVVPCSDGPGGKGTSTLKGRNLTVRALSIPRGQGLRRKLDMPGWLLKNSLAIWREVRDADAVHTPIPGDVGTVGMIMALLARKPLFVRHCGNWLVQRTLAERFWKWSMEFFGGGQNVMLATGGADEAPSQHNPSLRWIFSTSLRREQIAKSEPRSLPADGRLKLAIACRQERFKGTDIVIESLPEILTVFPKASLNVIGDGSQLQTLKKRTEELGLTANVTFHGKLEHPKVLSLLKENHIFCYPTSASEGFPKVVLEALASGMPVVTTRVSVLPTLLASGGGHLLSSPSPSELSRAVIDICSDELRFGKMSAQAIKVAQNYSLEDWRDLIGNTLREAWNVSALSQSV